MAQFESYEAENVSYWTKRTPGYSGVNQEELASEQRTVWGSLLQERISSHFSGRSPQQIRILDVGTGPGFFSIIMTERGYSVTAVDYTATMLEAARENAGTLAEKITFLQMNAEELSFENSSFDVVISRNLTWNLHNPEKAYTQWCRVLKSGGLLLNFDANWYSYLYDEKARAGHAQDRENIAASDVRDENEGTDVDAMEAIAYQAPLSQKNRPAWDLEVLCGLGMCVSADTEVWRRVWTREERINNASTPMFMVEAVRER